MLDVDLYKIKAVTKRHTYSEEVYRTMLGEIPHMIGVEGRRMAWSVDGVNIS